MFVTEEDRRLRQHLVIVPQLHPVEPRNGEREVRMPIRTPRTARGSLASNLACAERVR